MPSFDLNLEFSLYIVPSVYVVCTKKDPLNDTVLMSANNIWIH